MKKLARGITMLTLTIDMPSSAQVLGTKPEELRSFLVRENTAGVFKFGEEWRISIFTLAQLLNTTPQVLLELIEDYMLGSLMNEVEDDDFFEGEASWQEYQKHLIEAQA
jgi:hypothetical protein